jgi:signal transduction histidine kinase
VKDSFDKWLQQQDAVFLLQSVSGKEWLQATVFVVIFLILLSWPSWQAMTGISFLLSFLCFLPSVFFGVLGTSVGEKTAQRVAIASLGTSAGVFFFCSVMILQTKPPLLMMLFGVMYLYAASSYGETLRVGWKTPYPWLSLLLGTAAAFLVMPLGEVSFLALLSLFFVSSHVMLVRGQWTIQLDQAKIEGEIMREAFLAQLQFEQSEHVRFLRAQLLDFLGQIHDLSNQIQAISLSLFVMDQDEIYTRLPPDIQQNIHYLSQAAARAREIVTEMHQHQGERNEQIRGILATDCVKAATEAIQMLKASHPKVEFHSEIEAGMPVFHLAGGRNTIFRILENLLRNACQGADGKHGASRIELSIRCDLERERLLLRVEDNGSGLPPFLLRKGGFSSMISGKGSSGIGLYTVERLVRSTGGTILCGNREEGGAWFAIELGFSLGE